MCQNELYHHGIKGQKWGVRRFQKKDGSLTNAGKKRYADEPKKKRESRYDKLYAKYKATGCTDEEARKQAKGRVAAERVLIGIGATAAVAAAGYGIYRYHDYASDSFIKPNQAIQTVHDGDVSERIKPGNPFYAAFTKADKNIYASGVFSHFTSDSNVTSMYTKDGIKVASTKSGKKVLDELIKTDPEVADYVDKLKDSKVGKYHKKGAYDQFNYSLVLRNDSDTTKRLGLDGEDHNRIHKKFYDKLKEKGYGAVIDTNDSRSETFTFKPAIVFDDQNKHVISTTKATADQLRGETFLKGMAYASSRDSLMHPVKNFGPLMVAGGMAYGTRIGITVRQNKHLNNKVNYVKQYKKDNPKTKMSDKEISYMFDERYNRIGEKSTSKGKTNFVKQYTKDFPDTKLSQREIEEMYEKMLINN